jgi:hypothetical protein
LIENNRGSGGQWVYRFFCSERIRVSGEPLGKIQAFGAVIGHTDPTACAKHRGGDSSNAGRLTVSGEILNVFNTDFIAMSFGRLRQWQSATSYGLALREIRFVTLTRLRVRTPRNRTRVAVIRSSA